MYNAEFILTGQTALLMHNDDVAAADTLDAWRKDPANRNASKAGDDRSPPWTWTTYLYSDGKNVAMPFSNIMSMLKTAGAKKILKKQTTFKEITQSGIAIESEYVEFTYGGKSLSMADVDPLREEPFAVHLAVARKLGFSLFVKRAKVGTSKHVRVRPRFETWAVHGRCVVMADDVITLPVLAELFSLGGRAGLCDWRPGCKTPGPFGMFTATVRKI